MAGTEPEYASWLLDRLHSHPLQQEIYGSRSYDELENLAGMISVNGMEPIQVAPDGTILDGHQRRIIARKFLKWTEVPVKIRHDLAALGRQALDDFFVQVNLSTRALSKLQLAKACKKSLDFEQKRVESDPDYRPKGRVRDIVARRFGVNGRTMQDWLGLLEAPPEVQEAVDERRISLAEGLRIAKASEEQQAAIVAMIDGKVGVRRAMQKVLPYPERPPLTKAKLTRRWRDMLCAARDVQDALPGSLKAILPEHRSGLVRLLELADSVREFLPHLPKSKWEQLAADKVANGESEEENDESEEADEDLDLSEEEADLPVDDEEAAEAEPDDLVTPTAAAEPPAPPRPLLKIKPPAAKPSPPAVAKPLPQIRRQLR